MRNVMSPLLFAATLIALSSVHYGLGAEETCKQGIDALAKKDLDLAVSYFTEANRVA